ncbi:MAG: chromate transporter [bacterium]
MDTRQLAKPEKLSTIFWSFCKIGSVMFGGGYAMLPLLEKEITGNRKWCTQEEMVDTFALAQLIPGVVSINTAMFVGHRLRGWRGTIAATLGIIAVPFVVILAYAFAFDYFRETKWLEQATAGLRPAVAGMMLGMAYTLFRRTGKTILGVLVFLVVAVLVLGLGVSAVHVIIGGVLTGLCWHGVVIAVRRNKKDGVPKQGQ